MTRNISEMNDQDMDFFKMKREIQEKIKVRKIWLKFVKYMDVNYPKVKK